MENDRAKQLIVSLLQQSLIGHLDPSSNYKPQDTADAIIDKVNFEKSYFDIKQEHLIKDIMAARLTMMYEMEKLTSEQTLLKNFICGKLAAYDEVLDILNK